MGEAMKNIFTRTLRAVLCLGLPLAFIVSCSEYDLSNFQVNDNIEYRMFNLLDDYPSLYEAVNSLDQTTFNRHLGDAVNFKKDQFITMQEDTINLLSYNTDQDGPYNPATGEGYHEAHPVPKMLRLVRTLVGRINQQDSIDNDDDYNSYAADFFDLLDAFREADIGYEADILDIIQKGSEYALEREYADPGYMLKNAEEALADAIDPRHRIAAQHNQEVLGKQLIQSNSSITVNGAGKLVPDGSGTPIGLGNSVKGVGALLKGVFELLQDNDLRDSLYDVIRELGAMSAAKIPTSVPAYSNGTYATDGYKRVKDIMREEIENNEDFFTVGGKVYSGANDIYRRRTANEYSDSELRNVKKETLPPMMSLLLRTDRPGTMFADRGEKEYFAERFVTNLNRLNVDWDKAHLEESLYDMIRFDPYGRDRTSSANHPVIGRPAYDFSILEALMTTGGVTTNLGWFDGGKTNEQDYIPNSEHGHGAPSGNITLNDSVFAMQTSKDGTTGDTMYELILVDDARHNNRIFRSKDPFTLADANAGKCNISFDQNYCALNFLATHSVGDIGHPTGGNPNRTTSGKNQFVPYSPSGTKDTNTAAFNMNWVARGCWNGEGPYYFADPTAASTEINGKSYYRYIRPNRKTYAYVHKDEADPQDSSKWEYIYPGEGGDPLDVINYIGDMPLTNAVYHSSKEVKNRFVVLEFKIRIKIGPSVNAVVSFGPLWTYSIGDVITRINNAISAAGGPNNLCSAYGSFLKIVAPPGQTIQISNANNPDALGDNPVQVFLQDDFADDEVLSINPNSLKITQEAKIHFNIDNAVNKDVTFSVASPDNDGWWSAAELGAYLQAQLGSDYINATDQGIVIEGKSTVEGVAKVKLNDVYGNGMAEIFGSQTSSVSRTVVERYHRYRPAWRTDHYLIKLDRGIFAPHDMSSGSATAASPFIINEIIPESEPKRACASQEEAIYRNLQWLLTEKKIVLIVPMYLYVNFIGCTGELGFFQVIEGNGFEGLVNARKYRSNMDWAKKGTTGKSVIPGDYRLYVLATSGTKVGGLVDLNIDKVLDTMGHGSSNPAIIPHGFASISRMAFPRSEVKNLSPGYTTEYGISYGNTKTFQNISVGSREFEVDESDPVWSRRNGLVPVIVSALATAWEMSDMTHRGILSVLDSQFASLKPLFFYNRRTTGVMRQSWLPRIAGSEANLYDFMRPDSKVPGFDVGVNSETGWFGGWSVRDWYQLKSMPTSMTFMVDSDPSTNRSDRTKRADGLIAALTFYDPFTERGDGNLPNTRLITKLIKVLDKVGGAGFADPDAAGVDDGDLSTYGTRRKLFYGAEQFMTTQRIIKEASTLNLTTIDETNYKNLNHPSWMFTRKVDANSDGIYDDIRPEDVVVDEGLDISIGSDALGMGLAVYPDERDPAHPGYNGKSWYFFNDAADKAIEFTSDLGQGAGRFNATENLISLIDKFVTKVNPTQAQIDGLVHTLGIMQTEYQTDLGGGRWVYPEDLLDIQTRYMPTIMDLNKENGLASSEFTHALMQNGSLVEYILNTMSTPYQTSEIFSDLYGLLSHRLIAGNEDSYNSVLWSDLVEMQEGLVESIRNGVPMVEFTEAQDFQYNGPFGESIFSVWDPFGDLGRVFSQP